MVAVAPPESRISRAFSPGESPVFTDDPSDREGCGIAQNWTSYCSNNPVRAVDPSGLDDEDPSVAIDPVAGKVHLLTQVVDPTFQADHLLVPDGEYACLYLACLGIAEIETGQNLTPGEINDLTEGFIQSGALRMEYGNNDKAYWVMDKQGIINEAFKKLGSSKRATVAGGDLLDTPSGTADYTLISGQLGLSPADRHSQIGNSNGQVIRDPDNPKKPLRLKNLKYREVFIHE